MADKGVSNLSDLISKDVWDVIKDNYESKSYTAAITNLIHYMNEVIQDKAELEHLDNTKLMDQAFLGDNPKLKVNKLQTTTEKDIQSGVGYFLKGACLAIRNPRSHGRLIDDKLTADRIILFYDYVLDFIRKSEQPKLVDDWVEFIFDKDFVPTAEYAEEVFNKIEQKKRYDILVTIFRRKEESVSNKLNYIVDKLMNSITDEEKQEFIKGLDKELVNCCNNAELIMFFDLFPLNQWGKLTRLSKLKIENLVLKSIKNAYIDHDFDYEDAYEYGTNRVYDDCYKCSIPLSTGSQLSISAIRHIPEFENFELIKILINKIFNKEKMLSEEYFQTYFLHYIEDPNAFPF